MTAVSSDQRALDDGVGLTVEFRQVGPWCIFSLRGRLHARSVPVLESQFDRLGLTSCQRVVVDLNEVTEIDDTGARVLAGLRHYVRARGGHLTLIGTSPWVRVRIAAAET